MPTRSARCAASRACATTVIASHRSCTAWPTSSPAITPRSQPLPRSWPGEAAWVDLSQLEAMAAQIGPALLEPPAPRLHDRVYPCLGPDRWVAAEADLDEAWTRARPAEAAAEALQAQRIAAGVVQDGRDLVEHDPQLRACGFYPVVEHPVAGDFLHEGVPIKLSATPGERLDRSPAARRRYRRGARVARGLLDRRHRQVA